VRPFHVAAWIEDFPGSKPTIKQKLAAVRMLYDFLVVRQITPSNPAHAVRGPKYVVKKGKTPVWSREDAKTLLDSIPKDSVSGLRDLALVATMAGAILTHLFIVGGSPLVPAILLVGSLTVAWVRRDQISSALSRVR